MKLCLALLCVWALLGSENSFAFGRKSLRMAEIKGVTESQIANNDGKLSVMVRGKVAELLFRMAKGKQSLEAESAALQLTQNNKDGTHWVVKGKQLNCSKISNVKKHADDYACSFQIDQSGSIAAASESFSPELYNLARTETGSKMFKKARALASVTQPGASQATFSKGQAYVVYEKPGEQKKSETALIVFRGDSAREIKTFLETSHVAEATWSGNRGRKGNEIACVNATYSEPERCAVAVNLHDGAILRSANPLFR